MVHIDGDRAFSCQTQLSEAAGKSVTTIEGLSPNSSHPVQKAWLEKQVPQCGYCQSGMIMSAAALLAKKAKPTRDEIIAVARKLAVILHRMWMTGDTFCWPIARAA
jgi:isoquinoline 1-oxidoreductase subunit alpha